jgi:hypothetical protein
MGKFMMVLCEEKIGLIEKIELVLA